MLFAHVETRMEIVKALYYYMGPDGWFAYRHSPVCVIPRNGITKPARWVTQGVRV